MKALVREAQQLQRLERVPEAIRAYQRALEQRPELAECWYNLGVLLRQQRQLPEALAAYARALDHGVSSPEEVHLNRAVIYSDYLRQDGAAEQELRRALELNPTYLPAMLNLANLHEDLGRKAEAGALYESVLALDPSCREALARYANLQPAASADDRLIARIRQALRTPAPAADHASLLFALGRLLDGKEQYGAAFAAYEAANAASRASAPPNAVKYDRKIQEGIVDELIRRYPRAPVGAAGTLGVVAPVGTAARAPGASALLGAATPAADHAPLGPGQLGDRPPRPIFICGMFRSGSTLVEQLLAGNPDVVAGGELDILPRLAARTAPPPVLAEAYLDELRRMFPDASLVTDKRPDNFLHIGLIKTLFPEARIVQTTRDPLDNCLSIFFLHLDHSMSYAFDLQDIAHYFREYERLMAHWRRAWGPDLFELNYDQLVRQPAREGARLFEFLGLRWDERYLAVASGRRSVKTASVWQVREPIYTRSSGRAAHYHDQLGELRRALADRPAS